MALKAVSQFIVHLPATGNQQYRACVMTSRHRSYRALQMRGGEFNTVAVLNILTLQDSSVSFKSLSDVKSQIFFKKSETKVQPQITGTSACPEPKSKRRQGLICGSCLPFFRYYNS